MNCLSVYNMIMGRPFLNIMKPVISTHHLAIKFPTEKGIGLVRGDQHEARKCHVNALRDKGKAQETFQIEDQLM